MCVIGLLKIETDHTAHIRHWFIFLLSFLFFFIFLNTQTIGENMSELCCFWPEAYKVIYRSFPSDLLKLLWSALLVCPFVRSMEFFVFFSNIKAFFYVIDKAYLCRCNILCLNEEEAFLQSGTWCSDNGHIKISLFCSLFDLVFFRFFSHLCPSW